MHRNMNGTRMFSYSSTDSLPNPPCRIRAEAETPSWVELLNRPNQAQVALLNQIKQRDALIIVTFGDAHHEAQVGFYKMLLRLHVSFEHASCYLAFLLRR